MRQGENLSPILFALFLNDLETHLRSKGNTGITLQNTDDNIQILINMIALLYADDTVLISDDPKKLQKCLDDFCDYCEEWKLNINVSKTKALIFGTRDDRRYK